MLMFLVPLIAETTMHEGFMGWLVAGLTALFVLYREAGRFAGKADKVSVGPQPFEITPAADYCTKKSFNQHLDLDREEHAKIWAAIENHRSANSLKIEALIGKVDSTAAVLGRIGEEVREVARTANQAVVTATTALNEAQHKRSA